MKFFDLHVPARYIWAKSGDPYGHGLLAHMLDVAAVVEILLQYEPPATLKWAAQQFGLSHGTCARWLAVLAGLHDFGKAIPGFQAKWPQGMVVDRSHGLSFPRHACSVTNHSCATGALLEKPLFALIKADTGWLMHVIQAISAHHGFHFMPSEIGAAQPKGEPPEWAQTRQSILHAYWQTLAPQGAPCLDELSLPAVNWLAGLTSVADWIASNADWFPLGERRDDLCAYYHHACVLAEQALQHIRWRRSMQMLLGARTELNILLSRITQRQNLQARPLQQTGDRLLVNAKGPSLLLVEAPMGEGKTELAFLAHLRLQAANGHRGLYVALPTQATGNALFKRALTFLEAFGVEPSDVRLIHGGAWLNEDMQRLQEVYLRGINQDKGETLDAAVWFSQRRRPLLSSYGVGTIDQALFSILNVKHHFVRLWGLSNRVVVLDEVHAYDTYTSGLMNCLLQWLKALGSSVVLMSATLPRARRNELLAAWGVAPESIPNLPYPRLLLADAQDVRGEYFDARPLPSIRLKRLGEDLGSLAEQAVRLLEMGGCGAAIVNTVDRAQKLYLLLREQLGPDALLLFHARYPMDERSERERQVLACFGAQGDRPDRALMIATQVAEQSLDLDFDFMLSDLAPVDLLLQRAGRLHRHQRTRPSMHQEACLWVAGLQPQFPNLKDTAWEFVYDKYILGRTWALLGREQTLTLPGDIDRLVQSVYGDEPLPTELDKQVKDAIEIEDYGKYRAKVNKERQEALNIAISSGCEPQFAYSGKPRGHDENDLLGLRNVTRLGRETITLVPVEVVEEDLWRIDDMVFSPECPLGEALARQLYARQLRLSRPDVVKHFKEMLQPAAFAEHPLLRHCYPLPLTQGQYKQLGVHLRLDAELGLVYEK